MRRVYAIPVLFAWLLASGAQWDLLQSFAWGRMITTYSRTMPLHEAVRLTFTPDNLCGVCEFVAAARTRDQADPAGADSPTPAETGAKAKPPLATPPAHRFVFQVLPSPAWPREDFDAADRARPAPPTEPPRAA